MILKDQEMLLVEFGQDVNGGAEEQASMYATLIAEEAGEFLETQAIGFDGGPEQEIKEAVDVIVVAAGFLISKLGEQGARKAWNAVLESNLAKVAGGVTTREDGKVLQNSEYKKVAKAKMLEQLRALL